MWTSRKLLDHTLDKRRSRLRMRGPSASARVGMTAVQPHFPVQRARQIDGHSIDIGLGKRKRISQQFKARLRVFHDDNFNNIEAKKNVRIIKEPEPGKAPASNSFLLVAIDGVEWSSEIFARPRLHFDENERVFFTTDDIDLAAAPAAKITIKDFVTAPLQEPAGQFLSASPKPKMFGTRRRKPAAPPVRKIGDESDKVRAHAVLSDAVPCRSLCAG